MLTNIFNLNRIINTYISGSDRQEVFDQIKNLENKLKSFQGVICKKSENLFVDIKLFKKHLKNFKISDSFFEIIESKFNNIITIFSTRRTSSKLFYKQCKNKTNKEDQTKICLFQIFNYKNKVSQITANEIIHSLILKNFIEAELKKNPKQNTNQYIKLYNALVMEIQLYKTYTADLEKSLMFFSTKKIIKSFIINAIDSKNKIKTTAINVVPFKPIFKNTIHNKLEYIDQFVAEKVLGQYTSFNHNIWIARKKKNKTRTLFYDKINKPIKQTIEHIYQQGSVDKWLIKNFQEQVVFFYLIYKYIKNDSGKFIDIITKEKDNLEKNKRKNNIITKTFIKIFNSIIDYDNWQKESQGSLPLSKRSFYQFTKAFDIYAQPDNFYKKVK